MKHLAPFLVLLFIFSQAWAAIDDASKRRSSAGDYEVPHGAIDTAGRRRASAGDYSFGLGDSSDGSSPGIGSTQTPLILRYWRHRE
jgi:hypothetical protein